MWYAEAKAKIDIPLPKKTISEGDRITITGGRDFKYALWDNTGIFDLPEEYVGDFTYDSNIEKP